MTLDMSAVRVGGKAVPSFWRTSPRLVTRVVRVLIAEVSDWRSAGSSWAVALSVAPPMAVVACEIARTMLASPIETVMVAPIWRKTLLPAAVRALLMAVRSVLTAVLRALRQCL